MPRLRDHQRPALADDLLRLAQHGLHLARIALVARQLTGLRGRLQRVDPDHTTLGLRHDLLRDDDDVAVLELGAPGDQRAEVVALPDLGQAAHGDDLNHETPVTRIPACAL